MSLSSCVAMTNPGYGNELTATVNVAAGDTILIVGIGNSNQSWNLPTDDDGNTYVEDQDHSGNGNLGIFRGSVSSANASLNVSLTLTANRNGKKAYILVISGGVTLDDSGQASESVATDSHAMPSVTLSGSGIVVYGTQHSPGNSQAGSTGWDFFDPASLTYQNNSFGYEETSGTKSGEGLSTPSTNETSDSVAAAYTYSGGSGGSVVPIIHQQLAG